MLPLLAVIGYWIIWSFTRIFFLVLQSSCNLVLSVWIPSPSDFFFFTSFQHFVCTKIHPFQLCQIYFPNCVLQRVQPHFSILVNLLPCKHLLMEIFLALLRCVLASQSRLITKPRCQRAEESIKPQLHSLVLLSLPAPSHTITLDLSSVTWSSFKAKLGCHKTFHFHAFLISFPAAFSPVEQTAKLSACKEPGLNLSDLDLDKTEGWMWFCFGFGFHSVFSSSFLSASWFLWCDINYLGYLNTRESPQLTLVLCNISRCLHVFVIPVQMPCEPNNSNLRLAFGGMRGAILHFLEAECLIARQSSLGKIQTILP